MRVLCVGPLPPPVHGQAVAFQAACAGMSARTTIIGQNLAGMAGVRKTVAALLILSRSMGALWTGGHQILYLTVSRSVGGSARDLVLLLAARCTGVAVVAHVHGADLGELFREAPGWYRRLLRWGYARAQVTVLVPLGGMEAETCRLLPGTRVRTVPNFFDPALDPVQIVKEGHCIRILYLSNIMKSKGIFELLEAFAHLRRRRPEVTLDVAGLPMGDEQLTRREAATRFREELARLGRGVTYHGVVAGDAKTRLLARSDILVLASTYRSEAVPLSVLEAMRCGNALVLSRHRHLPAVADQRGAVFVTEVTADSVGSALERLCADIPTLRLMQAFNSDYARRFYSQRAFVDALDGALLAAARDHR